MGGLTTDDTYENPRSHVNHNHPADRTGVEVTKLCTTMKALAKQSRSRPNQILTQALLEASDEDPDMQAGSSASAPWMSTQ